MSDDPQGTERKPWFDPFRMGPKAPGAIRSWWKSLEAAKGERAEMRRAAGTQALVFVPAYHRLRLALEAEARCDADGLAVMAGCLAALREPDPHPLPQALAGKLSPLRFRRLLHVSDADDALRLLRRSLAMLNGGANVRDVAAWAYAFGTDALRESAARRFAFAYYGERLEARPISQDEAADAAENA